MFFIRFNLIRKSLENMLQEMLEEETKHMNTAEVTLLLKATVSKFIERRFTTIDLKSIHTVKKITIYQ